MSRFLTKNNFKEIRVVVLGQRGFPNVQGGIERHCQELYPRLAKLNCDVTILARKGYVSNQQYEYKGVKVIPLWTPRKKSIEAIFHTAIGILWLSRRRKDYDIVHIHAIGPSLLAPAARWLGFVLVITDHGPDYKRKKWGPFARFMLRLGERLGARHAHLIIAVSKNIRDILIEKYRPDVYYVPNGISIPGQVLTTLSLSRFGLEPARYFMAVGRLVPEKGFHDLIEAYAKLNTDWKLVIVGDADHKDKYSRSLKKRAAQIDGVVMTGFQKGRALGELYSNSGLFILPSYYEGLPIVLLEAVSYNLPILVSDIPANREVALPEETFPVGNVEALSQRLAAFLKNPSSLNSPLILDKKKQRLETEFNWDVIALETVRLYQKAAGAPSSL